MSVAQAVTSLLPHENIVYVADTAYAPYGEKTDAVIYQRMHAITQFLLDMQVKAIVVACNTATTSSIDKLRAKYTMPIIGVEPGVKPAVLASKTRVVGVLATPRTLQTLAFSTLAQRFAADAKIVLQPCPEWVSRIEALDLHSEPMRGLLKHTLQPLLQQDVDTLVLGCTHYNFIAEAIADIVGPHINIIRTELAVAQQLKHKLSETGLLAEMDNTVKHRFYTSGSLDVFKQQLRYLWPQTTLDAVRSVMV